MTGPAFDAVPFDPTQVARSNIGSATLNFADGAHGTFTYTVNAITRTKSIERMAFAAPIPACAFVSAFSANDSNHQGLWWADPAGSESGWGINLNHQGDIIFATWFTYARDGTPTWLTTTARKDAAGDFVGPLYQTSGPGYNVAAYDSTRFAAVPVGDATFSFDGTGDANFEYSVFDVVQTKRITRTVFGSPMSSCS
jgi:hypothetical protein